MSKPPEPARKGFKIVIKHPVKPPSVEFDEDLSSSCETESETETPSEPMEVDEQVTATQGPGQHAIGESSRSMPIEFQPIPRKKRTALKLKEQEAEEEAVRALTLGPEPREAQLSQEPIEFEELLGYSRCLVPKELFESPKMRYKRLRKELEARKKLEAEVADILADIKLSDPATSADQHKGDTSLATDLDQHHPDIHHAPDQCPGDNSIATSPADHEGAPPATSQYPHIGDVPPPASPDHHVGDIPPPTDPYPTADIHPRNIPPTTDQDFEGVTPPASPDHHASNTTPTNPYQHFRDNTPAADIHPSIIPPLTDQDFEDVTPPASPDHDTGGIPPPTNRYQHFGDNTPAADINDRNIPPTTDQDFEDVTPPASPDHHVEDIPSASSHHPGHNPPAIDHQRRDIPHEASPYRQLRDIPPATSQALHKRDTSLATSSNQYSGHIPPSRTPIESIGNRFLGAVQSALSTDGATMNDGWSPNPTPTLEPTEVQIERWHGMFKRHKTPRLSETEADADQRQKPSSGFKTP